MPVDYNEYPPYWKKLSRHIRFVRAGNRCEWCGAENYQPHPDTGSKVILTVAHIDHDKTNNYFSNLAALCQKCHLNHDRWQHARNRRKRRDQETGQLRLPLLFADKKSGMDKTIRSAQVIVREAFDNLDVDEFLREMRGEWEGDETFDGEIIKQDSE